MPSDLERKNDVLSSSPGLVIRGHRIKIEELSSDIDTAYTSASTPFSDDQYLSPYTFYESLENSKARI
jgi:hypothetical protein